MKLTAVGSMREGAGNKDQKIAPLAGRQLISNALGGCHVNRIRMRLLAITLSFVVTSHGLAQSTSTQHCDASEVARGLCEVEPRLAAALRRNDIDSLAEIYGEEFELINYRGNKVTRLGVLNALRAGTLRFDSLEVSELAVRVYGMIGIISGKQNQVARERGRDATPHPKLVRFTHVYVLRDGRWRLVGSQITPILPRP